MNINNISKLQPYMFGAGDQSHAVSLLKAFLKSHSRIPTAGNFQVNNVYD